MNQQNQKQDYDINLDKRFSALELIDIEKLVAANSTGTNTILKTSSSM
jgi:hypothetical protein